MCFLGDFVQKAYFYACPDRDNVNFLYVKPSKKSKVWTNLTMPKIPARAEKFFKIMTLYLTETEKLWYSNIVQQSLALIISTGKYYLHLLNYGVLELNFKASSVTMKSKWSKKIFSSLKFARQMCQNPSFSKNGSKSFHPIIFGAPSIYAFLSLPNPRKLWGPSKTFAVVEVIGRLLLHFGLMPLQGPHRPSPPLSAL